MATDASTFSCKWAERDDWPIRLNLDFLGAGRITLFVQRGHGPKIKRLEGRQVVPLIGSEATNNVMAYVQSPSESVARSLTPDERSNSMPIRLPTRCTSALTFLSTLTWRETSTLKEAASLTVNGVGPRGINISNPLLLVASGKK
eukprot:scaffold37793_cov63-Phaeocystis_antarctica.AAC.2